MINIDKMKCRNKAILSKVVKLIKPWKYAVLVIFVLSFFIFCFAGQDYLNNKIIGRADYPGLQGEILFQQNIIYNFEKGNRFAHFNTDYLNYPFGENLGFGIANSLHLFMYIPLKFFFGIISSYNALLIIVFTLNFFLLIFLNLIECLIR